MPCILITDQDEIIDRAMHLFWQRGHKKTSVQDLIQDAGINRYSLYETFSRALTRAKKTGALPQVTNVSELAKNFNWKCTRNVCNEQTL